MMSQKWHRFFSIAIFFLSVIFSVIIVEVVLSKFFPQLTFDRLHLRYPAIFAESEILPNELLPEFQGRITRREFDHSIRINNLGFRGNDVVAEKGDQFRILAIGDSFTLGWGVNDDETYPRLLETILSGATTKKVEVINAGGASGFHPDTYYVFARRVGLGLDPDLIVIGFFIGNDLQVDISDDLLWKDIDADGLPRRIVSETNTVFAGRWMEPWGLVKYRFPIVRNSHLYQLIVHSLSEIDEEIEDLHAWFKEESSKPPHQYRDQYDAEMLRIVNRTQGLFQGIKKLAAERGIPIVVLMIPALQQVAAPQELVASGVDLDKPQKIFSEFFESEDIPYLDLLSASRASEATLYYPKDEHWNSHGQAFGAQKLADFILEQKLLP